jgi:rSAM/selenodomain-associated transferase 1
LTENRTLLLFTKPARAGEVKTRLIGALTAQQAAQLHAAFRDDLLERLGRGPFCVTLAWALRADEPIPAGPLAAWRQRGGDLGERLFDALAHGASSELVAAVGSDHPLLGIDEVEAAFSALEGGADMVFGPATDGGYYLVAGRREALVPRVFEEIEWSTSSVLETTLERCREVGVHVELLNEASDVDTPEDLERLCQALERAPERCPRTRRLLEGWGRLRATSEAVS